MNIIKNLKRICLFLSVCIMVMLYPLNVMASPDNTGQLTIKYPLSDVRFYIYKIADFSSVGEFDLEDRFDVLSDEITDLKLLEDTPDQMTADKWRSLSITLESYISSQGLDADIFMTTDADGNIVCEVEEGLYLLIAEAKLYGKELYIPPANLVTVPNRDEEGKWQNQIVVDYSSKVDIKPTVEPYTVQKIWLNDEYSTSDRPEQIVVDLYMDNATVPYDTVVLSAVNNWKYTWEELPIGHKWTASEREVPEHYKVSMSVDGNIISITNKYNETPPPPPPPTGRLWWPVPVLAVLGVVFYAFGWARKREEEK